MKRMQQFVAYGTLGCAFLGADAAAVGTRFTYTSDDIAWESTTLYGQPDPRPDTSLPSFSVSFLLPGNWLDLTTPTTFVIPNRPDVTLSPYIPSSASFELPYAITANGFNEVTVGLDGEVNSWNFSLAFNPIFHAIHDPYELLYDKTINYHGVISSEYGGALCDCDAVQRYFHNATTAGGAIVDVGPVEIDYRDANMPGNWSLALVSAIPEPSNWLMLLSGLALLTFVARRWQCGRALPA